MDKVMPDEVFKESAKRADKKAIVWDELNSAVIGSARIWRDGEWRDVLVYGFDRVCDAVHIAGNGDEDYSDAVDFVEYNIAGGYLGPYTPLLVREWV